MTEDVVTSADRDILRRLAAAKMAVAAHPANCERRTSWLALDAGTGGRPMILAEWHAIDDPHKPDDCTRELRCVGKWARGIEQQLRRELLRFEQLQDDHVVEPWFDLNWRVIAGDYGVQRKTQQADNAGGLRGAIHWEPALADLDADFDRLKPRTFGVDREATWQDQARVDAAIGDICPTRIRGSFFWTMGMTIVAINLIGLENLMLAMYDNPSGLHRLMAFLRDDHLAFCHWLEREGLLSLNNENDYIGSGSEGHSRDLPRAGLKPADPVRLQDCWVLSESQETVGVGPELFETFIFPYQQAIVAEFGKCYYGCCEPVNSRWHVLKKLPNLARISVSPWSDQAFMAAACGRDVVFSRKPNPAQISTALFDETTIRADLRQTLETARGCRLEIIMKDVHTLHNEPGRIARWVALAREECARAGF
jgi:hypothetical protein